MGFFNLFGRIGLNTQPFEQGLDKAEKKAVSFADKIEHKVGKKLNKAFGVGLFAGLITHPLVELVFGGGSRAKEIDENSRRLGLTAEKFQMLEAAAKDAGIPIDEMAAIIDRHSASLSKGVDRLEQYRNAIKLTQAEVDAKVSQMREMDRAKESILNDATKFGIAAYDWTTVFAGSIAGGLRNLPNMGVPAASRGLSGSSIFSGNPEADKELQDAIARRGGYWNDPSTRLNKKQINALMDEHTSTGGARWSERRAQVTPWQQIGAYVGTPGDVMIREQRQTNEILKRLEVLSRAQIDQLRQSGGLFR